MTFPTKKGGVVTIVAFEEGSPTHCLIRCSICHEDKELFPEPLKCSKYKLKKGQQCCACGKTYYWTEKQYIIRVKRQCDTLGYKFSGWQSKFKGVDTRLNLTCDRGHKYSPSIDGFLGSRYRGCITCRDELLSSKFRRPESQVDDILNEYLGEDHIFVKWNTAKGYINNNSEFTYLCKKKEKHYTRSFNGIKMGKPSCCYRKGGFNPDISGYFYLSFWCDNEGNGFYKYEITNKNPNVRLDSQQRKSDEYRGRIKNVIWFENGADCCKLEDEVSNIYKNMTTDELSFKDGYTETILWDVNLFQELAGDIASLTGLSIYTNIKHEPYELHNNELFEGKYYMVGVEDLN